MRHALFAILALFALPALAQPQAPSEAVTVSTWYGDLTVTGDSVRYSTETYEGAVSRDLIAALTRPDMIVEGRVLPDRSDPWPAETVESHLVFAAANGPLPTFPPLRALPDSLDAVIAEIAATLAAERVRADSARAAAAAAEARADEAQATAAAAQAALATLQAEQEEAVAEAVSAAVAAERAAIYATLRAIAEGYADPR